MNDEPVCMLYRYKSQGPSTVEPTVFRSPVGEITIDMSGNATASGGHKVLSATAKGVEIESSRYPFCFDPDTKKSSSTRSITPRLSRPQIARSGASE